MNNRIIALYSMYDLNDLSLWTNLFYAVVISYPYFLNLNRVKGVNLFFGPSSEKIKISLRYSYGNMINYQLLCYIAWNLIKKINVSVEFLSKY